MRMFFDKMLYLCTSQKGTIMYTRKHFKEIAEVISLVPNINNRQKLAAEFTRIFSTSNPHFNENLFLEACNLQCNLKD